MFDIYILAQIRGEQKGVGIMKLKLTILIIIMLIIGTSTLPISKTLLQNHNENQQILYELINVATAHNEMIDSLDVTITKPEKALYVNDEKLFPIFFTTIIFGSISIMATVSGGSAEKIEFYIDDVLKFTDFNEPYTWIWDETVFFNHEIMVKVYAVSQIGIFFYGMLKFFLRKDHNLQ